MTEPTAEQTPSPYRDATLALAASAQAGALAALALPVADDVALGLTAGVVVRSASRAVALADLSLAGLLDLPPLGLLLTPDVPARVSAGLATLRGLLPGAEPEQGEDAAARRQVLAPRVGRLARAETLDAGRDGYTRAMVARRVPGWTRVTGPEPCPLCAGLAARGEVLPASFRMARHPGCSCIARPTTRGRARDAA